MNRYICKACGRKLQEDRLYIVGSARNTQNVWLCKPVPFFFRDKRIEPLGCKLDKWKWIRDNPPVLGQYCSIVQDPK